MSGTSIIINFDNIPPLYLIPKQFKGDIAGLKNEDNCINCIMKLKVMVKGKISIHVLLKY